MLTRLLWGVAGVAGTLLAVSVVSFLLVALLPGDLALLVLADAAVPSDAADFQVSFNTAIPATRRGVLFLPTLQLLGYYRAIFNGLNPDQPHNLTAVVVLNGAG